MPNPLTDPAAARPRNPLLAPRPLHSADPIGPVVLRRKPSSIGKKTARIFRTREAAKILEGWHPSQPMAVLTRGQIALTDLIGAVADQLSAPHVIASAWASAPEHLDYLLGARTEGRFASLALILDRLLASRTPEAVALLRTELGADQVAITRTHARFALLWNEDHRVVLTSSADLTRNPGFELHQLDTDPELFDFLAAVARDTFAAHAGHAHSMSAITAQFNQLAQ